MNIALSQASDVDLTVCGEEESDDWLSIDAEDFETMLQDTMGPTKPDADAMEVDNAEDRIASEQASKLQNLAKKVEEFVEGEGDLEGARFTE